jgi:DNA-binding protein H-NS
MTMAHEQRENEKEIVELMTTIESALDKLPFEDVKAVIGMAEEKLVSKQTEAKDALLGELSEFKEKAAKLGIPFNSLFSTKTNKKAGKRGGAQPVKYRGPNGQTWAGRGKKPNWLSQLEAEGRNREDFREHAAPQ